MEQYIRLGIFCVIALVVIKFVRGARNPAPAEIKQEGNKEYAPPESNYSYINKVKFYRAGQPQLIEMFGTHCPPCKQMVPHMARMQQEYKQCWIMSVTSDQEADVQKFIEENPAAKQYNISRDAGGRVGAMMQRLGAKGIPHCFLFDEQGKMVYNGHPNKVEPYLKALDKRQDGWKDAGKGRKL
ncbi:FixW_protein [Hexamita inflata]|uniref:Putative n=1 Tax=Hexamita inflata TaxID=28002 RepID=A0AA86QC31_9EUKA|nr:FixW protein [Hexamita inflata]